MPRRLDADETKLWARVTETVRPLHPRPTRQDSKTDADAERSAFEQALATKLGQKKRATHHIMHPPHVPPYAAPTASKTPSNTLDGGWDKRISAGRILPDVTVDLHGHTLTSAYARLEQELARAIKDERRVMLVITGKPPRADQDPNRPRGLIRQQIPNWLASSTHRHAIAAIRNAHPRHGGQGALYLIFRRRREQL